MKIKRKIEFLTVTNEKFFVRKTATSGHIFCAECGNPMLTAEQAAGTFGFTQRRIFRFIEASAVHFTETETGAVLICEISIAALLKHDEIMLDTDKLKSDG